MRNLTFITTLFYLYSSIAGASIAIDELGERLFLETRFSKNKQHSCASCHKVDQDFAHIGMRGYNDDNKKSPIQFRSQDKKSSTLRNTPALVEISSSFYPSRFVHYDGEVTIEDTVFGNMSGRNMGWLPGEADIAKNHIIKILKTDDGSGDLAQEFGGAYTKVFKEFNINLMTEKKQVILDFVTKAVVAYVDGIEFEKDANGNFIGSPYDQFLIQNKLPTLPTVNETPLEYSVRLRQALQNLQSPKWIAPKSFGNHQDRIFEFGPKQFSGLKTFLNLPNQAGAKGMCLNCHTPPLFSDGLFHNVGRVQFEYEQIHGQESFNQVNIPNFHAKKSLKDNPFLVAANSGNPKNVDLGAWNVFGRVDKPEQNKFFEELFCPTAGCSKDYILNELVGRMKTPTLRNLGHSNPYFHSGSASTILDAVTHYKTVSELNRTQNFRNLDHRIQMMKLTNQDIQDLTAFLESLNENYE
jgi:cytochrome c peroxidase